MTRMAAQYLSDSVWSANTIIQVTKLPNLAHNNNHESGENLATTQSGVSQIIAFEFCKRLSSPYTASEEVTV